MAVVNCRDDEEICEEFEVFKAPKVLLFSPNTHEEPIAYKGKIEEKAMSTAAYKLIQSFIEVVNEKNVEGFLEREPNKRGMIVFTEKKSVHPLFKVLSKKFRTYFKFGVVKNAA